MHELVKIAMRGPRQAVFIASISVLIPMMFWVGAGIIGLVTLRKGFAQGFVVFSWATIPALVWWFGVQDPGALIVLLSAFVMSAVLRYTVSWFSTLVAGGLIALVTGMLAPVIMPEMIDILMEMASQIFKELAENAQQEYDAELQEAFRSLMIASFAASFYGMAIGSVFLARAWQSQLFNPGGWQAEFHQMRMSSRFLVVLLLLAVVIPSTGVDSMLFMMIAIVPILVCGIALVHGVFSKKQMGGHWLFGFYFSVVMLFPTVLILLVFLAMLDSLVNFRERIQTS